MLNLTRLRSLPAYLRTFLRPLPEEPENIRRLIAPMLLGLVGAGTLSRGTSAEMMGKVPVTPQTLGGSDVRQLGSESYKALGALTDRALADRAAETMSFADFGCALDGVTADAANAQLALNWLGGGFHRRLILPPGKTLRVDAPLALNCRGIPNLRLEMLGVMTPDLDLGDMLSIFNLDTSRFLLNVESGGSRSVIDYTQADPPGAQQAFVIRGARSCTFDVRARGYAGRAVRTKLQNTGENKTSVISLRVVAEAGAGGYKTAQALYAQGSSFWGEISEITHPVFDYPVIFDDCTDVTIKRIEGPNIEIRGGGSIWADTLLLGDGSGTGTNLKITRKGGGNGARRIDIDRVLCASPAIGVHIDHLSGTGSLRIGDIQSVGATQCGLLIQNSQNIDVTLFSVGDRVGAKLTGAGTHEVDLKLKAKDTVQQVVIKDAGVARVRISGHVNRAATDGTTACMTLSGNDLGVVVDGLQFYSITGTHVFELDAPNQVFTNGGSYSGLAAFAVNAPIARNVQGYRTEASGVANFPAGANSITISHGLAGIPDNIQLTARSVTNGIVLSASSVNSSTFAINTPSSAAQGFTVYWRVSFGRLTP